MQKSNFKTAEKAVLHGRHIKRTQRLRQYKGYRNEDFDRSSFL
jgi:hypothetical protein